MLSPQRSLHAALPESLCRTDHRGCLMGDDRATIYLYDTNRIRSERVQQSLHGLAPVEHYSQLQDLQQACAGGEQGVVLLPFDADQKALDRNKILEFLRAFGKTRPILVFADTTHLPIALYCQPLAAGARQLLNDQSDSFLDDLRDTVARLLDDLRDQAAEEENLAGMFAARGLVAGSVRMRDLFRRVLKASFFSDLPVLLLGETGTGKQRIAEAIHDLDEHRRTKPFVAINCAALSKNLAESELFGHCKGAFSGSSGERMGHFRAANGGTLLLDEVGELDLELQPKLLRVLQERKLLPVGEDYEHPLDVRIIAATNRSLETMIAEGKFREDLYQRLNVFRLQIPPLRERPEDIALQADHFLKTSQREGLPTVTEFDPMVLKALMALPWEGNTRQLENFIREVMADKSLELARQRGKGLPTGVREDRIHRLEMKDLPAWVIEKFAQAPPSTTPADSSEGGSHFENLIDEACEQGWTLNAAVEVYERRLVEKVLERTNGNRTHAAKLLGVTLRSVFNKIKKFQLE
jgi:two-component system response regulator AtoC